MIIFTIDYPSSKKEKSEWNRRYGLNAYYAGKHYYQRKKDAEILHYITVKALRKAGIKKEIIECPVEILFFWDDGLDCDNHAVIGKAILDALKGWIIIDDSRKYVKKISHEFWDGGKIKVEVRKK